MIFSATKMVALGAGEDYTSANLTMPARGTITGRVLDENKEPVPNEWVYLIGTGYSLGELRHVFTKQVKTDDKGEYKIDAIVPHSGYLLLAKSGNMSTDAVSDAPLDSQLRKQVYASTFYGGSTIIDSAQPITITAGTHLEAMDIVLKRAPSFCFSGILRAGGRPKSLLFGIEGTSASGGIFGDSGMFGMALGGKTGDDGKIRICGLTPAQYELTAIDLPEDQTAVPPFFGKQIVTITDRDIFDVQVNAAPYVVATGHVVLEGERPEKALDQTLTVWLQQLTRASFMGELKGLSKKVDLPGDFSLPTLLIDDYRVNNYGLKGDLYVRI